MNKKWWIIIATHEPAAIGSDGGDTCCGCR
jgi:hypothetical protein